MSSIDIYQDDTTFENFVKV